MPTEPEVQGTWSRLESTITLQPSDDACGFGAFSLQPSSGGSEDSACSLGHRASCIDEQRCDALQLGRLQWSKAADIGHTAHARA